LKNEIAARLSGYFVFINSGLLINVVVIHTLVAMVIMLLLLDYTRAEQGSSDQYGYGNFQRTEHIGYSFNQK